MAKEVAQIMQSWLPAPTAPDPSSQQRVLDLEAQLAALKGQQPSDASTPGSAPTGSTTQAPIVQALHGQQAPASTFSPQSMLTMRGSPLPWFESRMITSLTDTAYKKWISSLQLPQPKQDVLDKNLAKALEWWNKQPEGANDQIQRVLISFGLHPLKLAKHQNFELMAKVMTVVLTCAE